MQKNQSGLSIFHRYPKTTIFCLFAFSCLVSDFIAGSAYRLIYGYSLHDRAAVLRDRVETDYRIESDIFHHTLAPNKTVDNASWGSVTYPFRSNSLGFRDAHVREVELDTDRWRILFIGDSFTEGIAVKYEDTFVGRIADEYKNINIDVLNAAVISYSPVIYWRKIKYLIEDTKLDFDEVVVFLDISDADDEAEHYAIDEYGNVISRESVTTKPSFATWFGDFLRTYTVATYIGAKFLESSMSLEPDHVINQRGGLWTINERYYLDYGRTGLELMSVYMDRLVDLLQRHDIGLTVAVYPWPDQIVNGDLNSLQVEFWDEWSNKHRVRFINYFPHFIFDAETNVKGTRAEDILTKYFVADDIHWNARGHKLIADLFLRLHVSARPVDQ